MATIFLALIIASVLAAVASWALAVVEGLRIMADNRAGGQPNGFATWALLLFWPFALHGRARNAEAHAARTSKATVAFFVSITLAVAATSAYTNLTMRPHVGPTGSVAPGTASSKS